MDTPKRADPPPASASAAAQQQIETPRASKFEESPVFNYINSLSPIMPVKSVHITQAYHSINFSSIPPIFASPHVSLPPKESSRPATRVPLSELPKQDFLPADGGQENSNNHVIICSGVSSDVVDLSDCPASKDACGGGRSLASSQFNSGQPSTVLPEKEASSSSPCFHYGCASPTHGTAAAPCFIGQDGYRFVIGTTSLLEYVRDCPEGAAMQSIPEIDPQGVHEPVNDQNREAPGCDWEDLISDDVEPLLIFDPSHESDGFREQFQDFTQLDASQPTMLAPDDTLADHLQAQSQTLAQLNDNTHRLHCPSVLAELPSDGCVENISNTEITDHTPLDFSVSQNNTAAKGTCSDIAGTKICDEVFIDDKANPQNQRGLRRRCLVFEMAGQRRSMHTGPNSTSLAPLLPHHVNATSDDGQSVSKKPGFEPPKCLLPGIGLHLNSLASTSNDIVISRETLDSGNRLISMPYPISQYPPHPGTETAVAPSSFVSNDSGSSDVELQDVQLLQDSTQENVSCDAEASMPSSPKKKKRKLESTSDSEGCKRCHCKKSKCLKLYCECFAAGVYCVEPCTCQGCFNKPMHEDTVLATRKQIESRNPLAFAPKVIRTSEPPPESGEEANKTPASARHKRGCNCKKSSCLKKYCECYQGGVGCSISCRCEGCKNTFGRKEGITPISINDHEPEVKELSLVVYRDGEKADSLLSSGVRGGDHFSECTLPLTPSTQTLGPHLQFVTSGKPPRASTPAIAPARKLIAIRALGGSDSKPKLENKPQPMSDDDTPEILREHTSVGVKVSSPNKKRVSPPHTAIMVSPSRKGCRKLILKSIPSFPSLTSDSITEATMGVPSSSLNPQLLS